MTLETLKKPDISEKIEVAVAIFIEALSLTEKLELVGTTLPQGPKEAFVIRDLSKPETVEGAYVEVSIAEVIKHVMEDCHMPNASAEKAQEIIGVINNERKGIVLEGVTRIVGYYSRTNNWNKSKVGELRDRAKGSYGLTGQKPVFQADRLNMIDSL